MEGSAIDKIYESDKILELEERLNKLEKQYQKDITTLSRYVLKLRKALGIIDEDLDLLNKKLEKVVNQEM